MTTHAIFGMLKDRSQAASVIRDASRAGFSINDISVLVPELPDATPLGSLGLLTGLTPVEIPGLSTTVGAGPLIAALAGWSTAGVAHGLTSLRISEAQAHAYEQGLANGHILLSVETDQTKDLDRLKAIFTQHLAADVASSESRDVSPVNSRPSRPPAVIPL